MDIKKQLISKKNFNIDDLINLMNLLRDPKNGCPWDLEQDFESISQYTIDEAYEVADAIQNKNFDNLKEELGDLLFQIIYHSQIAKEKKLFEFNNVINIIVLKMIRRHPHIFKYNKTISSSDQEKQWDIIKEEEEKEKNINNDYTNSFSKVPSSLPPINRTEKIQSIASKKGFDWSNISDVIKKLYEEIKELEIEINKKESSNQNIQDEAGDILFTVINLIRKLQLDTNSTLRKANQKFETRFNYIEKKLLKENKKIENVSLNELERIWDLAKKS